MKLGVMTDGIWQLPLLDALDLAQAVGARCVELPTVGQGVPHLNARELLGDPRGRRALKRALRSRDLELEALNCSNWPLHPTRGRRDQATIRDTIRLAGALGVRKVVAMSGTPGDGASSTFVNWVWYPWPDEALELLERQWRAATRFWRGIAALAAEHGVIRIALELHPLHLVYNVPTLLRMRSAVGSVIGANVDPSHLFWQQMDPVEVIRALGPAVYHVHMKDSEVIGSEASLAGVLDQRPFGPSERRSWVFRTVGRGHSRDFWSAFLTALGEVGYTGSLSIEHEDETQPGPEGIAEAADYLRSVLSPSEAMRCVSEVSTEAGGR